MVIRKVLPKEKELFNAVVSHPCQSWEWGEFRKKTDAQVVRMGSFEKGKLVSAYQFSLHHLPRTKYTIGYLPRSPEIDSSMIASLEKIGQEKKCLFFRIEPDIKLQNSKTPKLQDLGLRPSPRPFFYRYTFLIDLRKSEAELLKNMSQKTRYNVRLAQRRGVEVTEDNSDQAFATYLKLLQETTSRQKFYAHTPGYHRKMWQVLKPAGIAHLLKAEYQDQILAAWIVLKFHQVLYYPYGASSSLHRNVMANNLMMWEAIKFGKKLGCKTFDLWGCLGPDPDPKNPWFGFHRFKEGYGGQLKEFVGSYDLVLNPGLYKLYNLVDNFRWQFLGVKSVASRFIQEKVIKP
jgi:lipid II:glycine glycyltransferase (peptidoglycan interpeptide bridge formation enzyme)